MNKIIIFIIGLFAYSFSNEYYADFDIIINNNPFSSNIFLHTQHSNFMAILDESLEPYWFVKSDNLGGLDFKPSHDYISYFDKINTHWVIADKYMNEIDTVKCISGITDYHDIRILNNGGYIIQSYDSLLFNMSEIVEGGDENAEINGILRIQEFNSNHELRLK